MREILFRGKRVDSGEWVEGSYLGDYFSDGRLFCIRNGSRNYSVDPSTVGQYTGLTDKNGVKIFEGDIAQVPFWRSPQSGLTTKGVVEFHRAAFSVFWDYRDYGRDFAGYIRDMEVIGNIHDNPELLEEES